MLTFVSFIKALATANLCVMLSTANIQSHQEIGVRSRGNQRLCGISGTSKRTPFKIGSYIQSPQGLNGFFCVEECFEFVLQAIHNPLLLPTYSASHHSIKVSKSAICKPPPTHCCHLLPLKSSPSTQINENQCASHLPPIISPT